MSSSERYERRLPELLDELAAPRTPAYFNDILGQVGRTRQRPGWTFPERWLPMSAVSERLSAAPRVPLRAIAVAALIILAAVVAIAVIAGSQQHRVPAPFGPAGNGLIMFIDDTGAIRAGNPVDGSSSVIVPSGSNRLPTVSPDGTHVAFMRENAAHDTELVVVDAQGRNPVVLATEGPLLVTDHVGWMPDSRRVVVDGGAGGLYAYDVVAGATPTTVVDAFSRNGLQNELSNLFRPPAGDEILVVGAGPQGVGLYRRPLEGGALIPILTTETTTVPFSNLASPQWSPDGSRVAFTLHPPENPDLGRVFVINADGTGLRQVSHFDEKGKTVDEEHVTWSPDGTRVAFNRWVSDDSTGDNRVSPVTVVNVATADEHEVGIVNPNGYQGWGWSPDGTSILEVPGDPSPDSGTIVIVDAKTGTVTRPHWTANEAAAWQRTAAAAP